MIKVLATEPRYKNGGGDEAFEIPWKGLFVINSSLFVIPVAIHGNKSCRTL